MAHPCHMQPILASLILAFFICLSMFLDKKTLNCIERIKYEGSRQTGSRGGMGWVIVGTQSASKNTPKKYKYGDGWSRSSDLP